MQLITESRSRARGRLAALGVGSQPSAPRRPRPRCDPRLRFPEAVAADAERLARFDREAKTLAALNHPNIAAIYGLEKSAGTTALVMELVEGPTLADRIGLKPANIKVRPDSTVKVLYFGLAKAN